MSESEIFMRRCLELGRIAFANGDAPVGCLIVKNGETIAEAIESVKLKKDPTAHAETEAVRAACKKFKTLDLSDCALFTNVEPCWMCAYAIRQTQIKQVVFGSRNEKVGGFSSKFPVLLDKNLKLPLPEIYADVLSAGCDSLLHDFEEKKKTKR